MDRKELKAKEAQANEFIRMYGFFVQHVVEGLSGVSVPYSFTSGLSYAADPPTAEFVMAGFEMAFMQQFLNRAVSMMQAGQLVPDGAAYFGRDLGQEVGIVPVRPHSSPSRLMLPEEAEAYLIVIPDENGRFPWEDGCDRGYAAQIAGFDCIAMPQPRSGPSLSLHRH
ncbi:DUF4262 domain-containing protein [Rhizobium laguerreae]|nr:DUF4262 domain-containing protein [Rhizobium laguerreae]